MNVVLAGISEHVQYTETKFSKIKDPRESIRAPVQGRQCRGAWKEARAEEADRPGHPSSVSCLLPQAPAMCNHTGEGHRVASGPHSSTVASLNPSLGLVCLILKNRLFLTLPPNLPLLSWSVPSVSMSFFMPWLPLPCHIPSSWDPERS